MIGERIIGKDMEGGDVSLSELMSIEYTRMLQFAETNNKSLFHSP